MSKSKICRNLDKLHPYVKQQALAVLATCEEEGLNVDIFETIRTEERQKWLVSNGKSKTMNSYHRLGMAVDFVFKTKSGNWTWRVAKEKWDRLAAIMEDHGFYSLWKRKGWDGPHGQVNLKGVRVTALYKGLRESDGILPLFWETYVNPELQKMGRWVPEKPDGDPMEETEGIWEVRYVEPTPTLEVAKPQPGLFSKIINFIKNLFTRA